MIKFLISLFLFYLMVGQIWAKDVSVPFSTLQNGYTLLPHSQVSSLYFFGNQPIIFCFTDIAGGRINWPYTNKLRGANLPIFLKTQANYTGEFADTKGTITIGNNLNVSLLVTCTFGF